MLSIKILNDEEFDALPYPEAKISMGVADTKTGHAFVRQTHSDELNSYLIEHEIEHLLGEDRDEIHHGGDGVYYKGFGNIFSGIGQAMSGAGQSIFGGLQKVGQGISGAGQNVMGMFGGGQKPPVNVGMQGPAGSAPRGGPQMGIPKGGPSMMPSMPSAPRMQPQISPIQLANPMNFMLNQGQSMMPKTPTPKLPAPQPLPQPSMPSAPQSPMSSFSLPMPSNAPAGSQTIRAASGAPMSSINPANLANFSMPSGGPNVIPTSRPGTPQAPAGGGTPSGSPMEMFKDPGKMALGAGLEGIGQFGIKTPNVPDISQLPSVQQLRSLNFNNMGELDPALEQAVNNDFARIEEREDQEFINRYKSLRPGADIESDSNFKRDWMELKRMQGQRRADAMAKYRFEMISKNLQITQAEFQQLSQIAQMDIDSIMLQMGLDYANAQKFKDTFSRMGDSLISQGLGIGQEQESA